ncbi:MAG: ATP-dependent sacrificial sulfur transferase LarE [Bradymonadia bacterium]
MSALLPKHIEAKLEQLKTSLREMSRIVIALSGGVDSGLLLRVATEVCPGKVTSITAVSASLSSEERSHAALLAKRYQSMHIELETGELEQEAYRLNMGNRCYFCRKALFDEASILVRAKALGTLCYGAIMDDLQEDRPGMKAAEEYAVRAPLIEAGFTKEEIRLLARHYQMSIWNKPAAPCLASRFPTGTEVTAARLAQVEQCERALAELGLIQFRARYYVDTVRIELDPSGLARVNQDHSFLSAVKNCGLLAGFERVDIDPRGYRTGSVHQDGLLSVSEPS